MNDVIPMSTGSSGEYASHEGDLDYSSCGLAVYRAIPMVHWYQWYDWYH